MSRGANWGEVIRPRKHVYSADGISYCGKSRREDERQRVTDNSWLCTRCAAIQEKHQKQGTTVPTGREFFKNCRNQMVRNNTISQVNRARYWRRKIARLAALEAEAIALLENIDRLKGW